MTRDTIDKLARRFEAPGTFISEYLRICGIDSIDTTFDAWLASQPEVRQMHILYALTTNQRAKATIDSLTGIRSKGLRRHLDIGCGYGGIVRKMALAGATSVGVEIAPWLADLARSNTCDVDASILQGSIFDFPKETLGSFDVITCTEVIEHVSDPSRLIGLIKTLLNPHGIAYFRIPNGRSIGSVTKDGHFGLFGISLLSREEAKSFKHHTTLEKDDYDHMGEYYSRKYYEFLLHQHGFASFDFALDTHAHTELHTVPAQLALLFERYRDWQSTHSLPFFTATLVQTEFLRYSARLLSEYSAVIRGDTNADLFRLDYLADTWRVIAKNGN